jgi:hypothetical protein
MTEAGPLPGAGIILAHDISLHRQQDSAQDIQEDSEEDQSDCLVIGCVSPGGAFHNYSP